MNTKTLLIPVDFTETSRNAVEYAAEFCRQFEYRRIVLLKSFYDTMFDEVVMSAGYGGVGLDFRSREHEEAEELLKQISKDLSLKNRDVEVMAIVSELPLIRAIIEAVHTERPQMVLLGSDTHSYNSDSYVARHAIQIAKASPVNVIVVPSGQRYQRIKEILVPVDNFSKAFLSELNEPGTHNFSQKLEWNILKMNTGQTTNDKEQTIEEELHRLLSHVPHKLFFSQGKETIDAVMNFLKEHPVQLILALPGKYSFLYRLTHRMISEAICRNTEKPVLIMKEFPDK